MILFVDDLEQRYINFNRAFPEKEAAGTIWTGDSETACSALLQFDITEVWLDHDAGDGGPVRLMWNQGSGSNVPTFFVVAQMLAGMKFHGKVYVHTGNPAGADRMLNLLKAHGIRVERPDSQVLTKIWGGVRP